MDEVIAKLRARNPLTKPSTSAEVRAAEERLGVRLPRAYVRVLTEVGAVSWPKDFFSPSALTREKGIARRPSWLVAFATDGGGNDDCFDVRVAADELSIIFWDHEDPPPLDEIEQGPGVDGEFLDWLHFQIGETEDHERKDKRDEIARQIWNHMEKHVPSPYRGFTLSESEVRAAANHSAPADWIYFLCTFGCWERPVQFLAPSELIVDQGRLVFALDGDRRFAFDGETVVAGADRWPTFFTWLFAMFDELSMKKTAPIKLSTVRRSS